MRKEAFNAFCAEVRAAGYRDGIWRWMDYWKNMTKKQRAEMAEILEHHPDVMKIQRGDQKVYQFPNGREWEE